MSANSQSFVTATTKLKSTLNTPSVINGVSRDAPLMQVCNEIVLVAAALEKQVQKSLPKKGESKMKLVGRTVAFQLKYKSTTEKLSRQLDKLQHRMESEILIDLRQALVQNQSDTNDQFHTLEKDLLDFRANLIAGQTHLRDLVEQERRSQESCDERSAKDSRSQCPERATNQGPHSSDAERAVR